MTIPSLLVSARLNLQGIGLALLTGLTAALLAERDD